MLELTRAVWADDHTTQNGHWDEDRILAKDLDGQTITLFLDYGCVLNVVDAVTREHLRDVSVVLAHATDAHYRDTRCLPEAFQSDVPTIEDSPLLLPDKPGIRAGWCRAPGYAWQRFAYTGNSLTNTVALSKGCEVEVTLTRVPAGVADASVSIYRADPSGDGGPAFTVPLVERPWVGPDPLRFSGVPAGPALVVVTPYPGVRFAGPRLAQIERDLPPGTVTAIQIDLSDPSTRIGLGSIRVTLPQIADRPIPSSARIVIESCARSLESPFEDYLSRKPNAGSTAERTYSDLVPGAYVVALMPDGISERVAVKAGEVSLVSLVLADPIPVTLSILHGRDKSPIDDASVMYRPLDCKHSASFVDVPPDPSDLKYRFRCQPGTYTVLATYPGHRLLHRDLRIDANAREFTLEMFPERSFPIRLRSVQGASDALLPEIFWNSIRVSEAGSDEEVRAARRIHAVQIGNLMQADAASADLIVDEPGEYVLSFPELSGLRSLGRLPVSVGPEGSQEYRLEVEYE